MAFTLRLYWLTIASIMAKPVDTVNQIEDVVPTAAQLFEEIHAVMHLYHGQHLRERHEGAAELTHMEGKVLGFFVRHAGATLKDLADRSGRDKGQLARLIAGLRQRGLLEGQPDEADRRHIRLHLTPEGRAAHRALNRHTQHVAELAAANLSVGERRQLSSLLLKIRGNLSVRG